MVQTIDIVFGKLGNRWCSAGLIWEPRQKGFYINLLTWTLDVSHGYFDDSEPSWEWSFSHLRKWSESPDDLDRVIANMNPEEAEAFYRIYPDAELRLMSENKQEEK